MLSQTPPMGWNTWNTFGHEPNEQLVLENVDAFLSLGLPDAGYEYIVIDDCWSLKERDPVTRKIVADPQKFPHGMRYIADYVHAHGLKFGMYSCAGVRTCGDYPGSYGYEFLDARTFAEYGCDFLKYDFCYAPTHVTPELLYRKMGMALRTCGREMLFSACNWGEGDVHRWIRSTGAHMYRSSHDIVDTMESFKDIVYGQLGHLDTSAPGCFNDLDMLTVGMYGKGLAGATGCNDAEYRSQFALWCMMSAPLMLGCDIRNLHGEALALVKNPALIRINQDPEARPPIISTDTIQNTDRKLAMFKHLSGGEMAFAFFNFEDQPLGIRYLLENCGLSSESGMGVELTDAFTGEPLGVFADTVGAEMGAHDCRVFIGRAVKL